MSGSGAPQWPSPAAAAKKFALHRKDFAWGYPPLPLTDVAAYEQSAHETIRDGVRFTSTDDSTRRPRIGYFQPSSGRFVVVSSDDRVIISHFRADDDYPYTLVDSDYP